MIASKPRQGKGMEASPSVNNQQTYSTLQSTPIFYAVEHPVARMIRNLPTLLSVLTVISVPAVTSVP